MSLKSSQFFRALLIVVIILLLQIPTVMIQGIVRERQSLRAEAISDITIKRGAQQTVVGPRLLVPYFKRTTVGSGEKQTIKTETQYGSFLPSELTIDGDLSTELLYRGIFEVPVYRGELAIAGSFKKPDLSPWGVDPKDIQWNNAELVIEIADAHAIQNQAKLGWNTQQVPFQPGLGKYGGNLNPGNAGIFASLKNQMSADTFQFNIPLTLNGSERLTFAPMGEMTTVKLKADWPSPSFQGLWLPSDRTITDSNFTALWKIPSLGRNFPQFWNSDKPVTSDVIQGSVFGVDLISPVDNYRMTERSLKYNLLFLLLTFVTFWLFEASTRLSVHPLQYLMVGAAMTMFYLLQLALSEHIGFDAAYGVASGAVVLLITAYSVAVLQAKGRGGIIGVMEAVLYGYLYFVLANESYSLLIGSLGLFVFLAIAMYFTRNMDWFVGNPPNNSSIPPNLSSATTLPPEAN
ncbi:MAG: cell envelope integrity protein CreD [Synechococcales cyanobacterium CRU_2_2]|nr:cell envelope integrity protein CreD [Synechococcales cyanobacterium CRU_2_2]